MDDKRHHNEISLATNISHEDTGGKIYEMKERKLIQLLPDTQRKCHLK